jgi:hypothetical protein
LHFAFEMFCRQIGAGRREAGIEGGHILSAQP